MAYAGLVDQGLLNKALTALSVVNFPNLNVSAGYFGDDMMKISFTGDASALLPTQVGAVGSGNLMQIAEITIQIIKSQSLANEWELQRQTNTNLGPIVAYTDSDTLPEYYIYGCVLKNISEFTANGKEATLSITVAGYYPINSSFYQ